MAMVQVDLGALDEAVPLLARTVALEEAIGHPDLESDRQTLAQVQAMLDAQG